MIDYSLYTKLLYDMEENKAGRPRIYKSVEEYQKAIEDYFALNPERPTVSGLSVFLGFADKSTLYDYANREGFSHPTKTAISRIEEKHEQNIFESGSSGSVFWLKNRGWTDQQQIQHSGGINIKPIEWVKTE